MTERETHGLVGTVGSGWTRRAITGLLAGTGLSALIGADTDAKKKKKKKKKKGKGVPQQPTCTRTCGNRVCGNDGCGGSCGNCGAGTSCDDGHCVETGGYAFDRLWYHGLQNPWGIAVDQDANVYVADSGNHQIQKFTSTGTPVTSWGEHGAAAGEFDEPAGVTVNQLGLVYVADSKNHRIQKFTSAGLPDGLWGEVGSEPGQFSRPQGIAYSKASGLLYITDNLHTRVQVFNESTYVSTLPLTPFAEYRAVTVAPDGTVYVVNTSGGCILRLTNGGEIDTQIGSPGSGDGQLSGPWDVAVDADGNVFVADRGNNRVQVFDENGVFVTGWGGFGGGDGQFKQPMGIDLDSDGNVYVTELANSRVQKFRPVAARRREH